MIYFFYFFLACGLSVLITPLVKKLAVKKNILDFPSSQRKIHKEPIPLLGGFSIFVSFFLVLAFYILFSKPDLNIVPLKFFLAIVLGGAILIFGGAMDDKFNLPPKISWLCPALASLIIVLFGIGVGIKEISNPFGEPFSIRYSFFTIPLSGIIMWLWVMGMTYTTKFLDGLDGLATGISLIGGATLFALSLTSKINQPITATLSIIFCGSLFGYLFYSFHPAKIFLGEGGSTFLGFLLGVLSIILGAKIATALLVMGIPILDVAWVIMRRLWYKRSPFLADRQHLHFRLLDVGFSQRQTVLILYGISAIFGFTTVFLQSFGKLIALIILFCVMLGLAITVVMLYKRKHPHIPDV
jgi:UDP-GlcNAc:undecaprenyl-phosphate/decaprenyl-phosphate GlcNAc-1-phosphate transferase